jgi:DNA polymerase-3 subunit epsilon
MSTFTALDFETAQPWRASICQVGIVRVEAGVIVREWSRLVRPPDNLIWPRFTDIHGIRPSQTATAASFAEVWEALRPELEGQLVVAHNAAFDLSCLRQALDLWGLPHPTFAHACTYRIYRRGLAALCREHGLALQHHDALSDARACARLYLMAHARKDSAAAS